MKTISWLLVIAMINCYCTAYKNISISEYKTKSQRQESVLVHWRDRAFYLNRVEILNNQLHGQITTKKQIKEDLYRIVHVHLYTTYFLPKPINGRMGIPLDEIKYVEVLDDSAGSVFKGVLVFVGVLGVIFLACFVTSFRGIY